MLNRIKEIINKKRFEHDETSARNENIRRDAKQVANTTYYDEKRKVAINKARASGMAKAQGKSGFKGFAKQFIDQPNKTGKVTSKVTTKKPYVMPNIFGSNSTPNSNKIPSLFDTNSGKKKGGIPKIF